MTTHMTHEQTIEQNASVAAPKLSSTPRSRVWWWVCAAFVLQITVWTLWIVIASHHKVQEVPLATVESRK